MLRIVFVIFFLLSFTSFAQDKHNFDSVNQKIDSLKKISEKRTDSNYARVEIRSNPENLKRLIQQMKEREREEQRQTYIRIGLGIAFLVILILGLLRRRKRKNTT